MIKWNTNNYVALLVLNLRTVGTVHRSGMNDEL